MYENPNTSTSWNEDSNAAVVTTIPPVSDFDQSFYKSTSYAETTYSNKATESTTLSTTYLETLPFDWDYFNTQYTQESSTNAITIGEANEYDLVNSIYEVTLKKCEPNLLRFYVRGNLNLFSLPDEQNWETSFKSNGVLYAAQLTTNGKEILSNKVHTFEYKNGGIYYYDTDIPISSYYDKTRDVFVIEVTIDDPSIFKSSSLENDTISVIHYFK